MRDQTGDTSGETKKPSTKTLHFNGGRFETDVKYTGFPLELAGELEKYQELMLATAASIWRERNPGKNVPRARLRQLFRFRLQSTGHGSTLAELVVEETSSLALPGESDIVQLTDEMLSALLSTTAQGDYRILDEADAEISKALKKFGSSFGVDEALVLDEAPGRPRYTKSSQQNVTARLQEMNTTVRGLLIGQVYALAVSNEFEIKPPHGRLIRGSADNANAWETLRELMYLDGAQAPLLWLECDLLVHKGTGRVLGIEQVLNANRFSDGENPGGIRLASLLNDLPRYGLDEDFEMPAIEALEYARDLYDNVMEAGLVKPGVFIDPEGGIRLEWLKNRRHTVVAISNELDVLAHSFDATSDEEHQSFAQSVSQALTFARQFVSTALPQAQTEDPVRVSSGQGAS